MSLFYSVRFFLFFLGCLIHCHVQFVACTFVTCCDKDQSINVISNKAKSVQWPLIDAIGPLGWCFTQAELRRVGSRSVSPVN